MGIAALGFIVLLGIVAFFFFIVLRGNVVRESTLPFSQGEYELSTTSYLSNTLSTRDDYGIKYSDLIKKDRGRALKLAVLRMLNKNRLRAKLIRRLIIEK